MTRVDSEMFLRVRVTPNAKAFSLALKGAVLVARVKARPLKGEANKELAKELGKTFGKKAIVVKGFKSREKTVEVIGLTEKELNEVLG